MHIVELPRRVSSLSNSIESTSLNGIKSTSLNSIKSIIEPVRGNENNDFIAAFEGIMNKFPGNKHTVFLISDGAFNDPDNTRDRSLEVHPWLEEHHQFLENLYMLLWNCPPNNYRGYQSDKDMWARYLIDHRMMQKGRLLEIEPDDVRGLGKFLQNMIESTNLGNALPKGKYNGWLQGDINIPDIPGYTSTITLSVWVLPTSTAEDVQASLHIGSEQYELTLSNSTLLGRKYDVPPPYPNSCIVSPRLSFDSEIYSGYYVLEPHFIHEDLKLQQVIINTDDNLDYADIYANTGVYTIWNSPKVSMELKGSYDTYGGGNVSILKSYRDCYSFSVVASFNASETFNIFDGMQIEIWSNDPYTIPNVSLPSKEGYVSFQFRIQARSIQAHSQEEIKETVSEWTSKPVGVRFHPTAKMEEPRKIRENGKEITKIPLPLSPEDFYDKLKAYVYVLDNKSSEKCTTGNSKEDLKIFGYPKKISAIQVEESQGSGKIPTNLLLIEKDGGKISLIINDFDKVVEDCGYRYLILKWDDNMPFYACDIKERRCDRADRLLSGLN